MDYNSETQALVEQSRAGDSMRDFRESPHYQVLCTHILDTLDRKAFETFKKINPDDATGIVQAQMMSKVIDQIKQEIENIISRGDLAKEYLRHSDEE